MSLHLYYKTTVWGLVEFDDTKIDLEKLINKISKGSTINNLYTDDDTRYSIYQSDLLLDTEGEILTLKENNGFKTIEIIKDNEIVWDNKNGLKKQ